ncbi:hypothetical protein Drose_24090 [Dactylosporangium roseum]|uniref:Uncharacterized protein n=1 Tax=Dactylosporangium roseum TaxID=47989 RepID=A0ABY5YX26_9ACTN|nr:hypothetical protein [Dactylosporangium roseum]UWZ34311.1 hypothetical protein Drose_24090 [Dactylosporangium roseum]
MAEHRSPPPDAHRVPGATFTFAGWTTPLRHSSEPLEHHAVWGAVAMAYAEPACGLRGNHVDVEVATMPFVRR